MEKTPRQDLVKRFSILEPFVGALPERAKLESFRLK